MRSTSPADPFLAHLDSLMAALRQQAPKALAGRDVKAIHDARVITRRIKAALEMLAPILSADASKPLEKATRKLRQRLGKVRDADVMLEHAREMKSPRDANAVQWLTDRLRRRRTRAAGNARDGSSSRILAKLGIWWELRSEIIEGKKAIVDLLIKSVRGQLDDFIARASASEAGETHDPHMLRLAGKSLRYTLELAKPAGLKLSGKTLRLFKKMQDALGLWHDLVMLSVWILREAIDCNLALHDPDLYAQALDLSRATLKRAHAEQKKMSAIWSKHGEEIRRDIRSAMEGNPGMPPVTPAELAELVEISVPTVTTEIIGETAGEPDISTVLASPEESAEVSTTSRLSSILS